MIFFFETCPAGNSTDFNLRASMYIMYLMNKKYYLLERDSMHALQFAISVQSWKLLPGSKWHKLCYEIEITSVSTLITLYDCVE